jgi:hypothetical protein
MHALEQDPGAHLQFLKRAHLVHLQSLAGTFRTVFPLSLIISLLPLDSQVDQIAQSIANLLLPFFSRRFPNIVCRKDNLKVDISLFPGWTLDEDVISVTTLLRQDTDAVLLCIYVGNPQTQSESVITGRSRSMKVKVSFRSALLLIGPTVDADVVRDTIIQAYTLQVSSEGGGGCCGGWIVAGHSTSLYDISSKHLIPACTPVARAKYNSLALTKAVVQQLFTLKPKPVRLSFVQAHFCFCDHYGWPLPLGALNRLLTEMYMDTELIMVLRGGRAMLTLPGLQVPSPPAIVLRIRAALEGDRGMQLLDEYVSRMASVIAPTQDATIEKFLQSRRENNERNEGNPDLVRKANTRDRSRSPNSGGSGVSLSRSPSRKSIVRNSTRRSRRTSRRRRPADSSLPRSPRHARKRSSRSPSVELPRNRSTPGIPPPRYSSKDNHRSSGLRRPSPFRRDRTPRVPRYRSPAYNRGKGYSRDRPFSRSHSRGRLHSFYRRGRRSP